MQIKNNHSIISYSVILLAIQGDRRAIDKVLKHFERYIISLSKTVILDEWGIAHYRVEEEIKEILEIQLIIAIYKFKLDFSRDI